MQLTGFDRRVAIVTGAARMRSIGRAIATGLANAGCDVVITGTDRPLASFPDDEKQAGWRGLDSVADEIEQVGRKCAKVTTDGAATDVNAAHVVDEARAAFGRVDILVNNAAAPRGADRVPVTEIDSRVWHNVIDINLHGTFETSRLFAQAVLAQGSTGCIVNISSIGGKLGGARTAAYASSKAAVHSLTSAMAQELGPHGIRVNAVCPGIVRTSRLDDLPGEQWNAIIEAAVPLRPAGEPHEVANLVTFLCSDQASWITGQAWNVDGGQLTII